MIRGLKDLTWEYQALTEKVNVPMIFSPIQPKHTNRIDIQSKVVDGVNCIPAVYRLLNNCASTNIFNSKIIHGGETPILYMAVGSLHTKN